MITYSDNHQEFIRELVKLHGEMEETCADTLNMGAAEIERRYLEKLSTSFTLRNKFTQGAVKVLKATARRASGEIRKMSGINAVVGVRKLKGGKEHYLKAQEEGDTRRGGVRTLNRVPVPLDTARGGESHGRPVAKPYRLNTGDVQTLRFNDGRALGTPGDGFGAKNGQQRWAILYAKTGLSGKGEGKNPYGWDLAKPFFFQGLKRGFGIFALKGGKGRIHLIRTLEQDVSIKARHGFEESVKQLSFHEMISFFLVAARKRIKQ